MTVRQLNELTWNELRQAADGSIALLPIGSQEQHGRHLPLGTDTWLAETVVGAALNELEHAGPDVVLLPTLPYGVSPHHLYAAALTLSSTTLIDVLGEILDSLGECGFRRMMIVNGHGGNDEAMRLAVKQAALPMDIAVGACNYWNVTAPAGDDGPPDDRIPGHAGWFETSLMLAAHPERVRTPVWNAPVEPPLFERPPYPGLVAERHGEWERVGGITDDPRGATRADGEQLLTRRVRGLVAAVTAFDQATIESHGATKSG